MKGKNMYEAIIDQLAESYKQENDLVGNDFGALEEAVLREMRVLGQGLLQRLVDSHSNGYQGSSLYCSCGASMRFVQHRGRDIHSCFGWIRIKRAYYHCSGCGQSLSPYDESSGLGVEQLSPGLAQACCLLAVDDSFESVSRKIMHFFGQSVSDDTVKSVVHHVGSVVVRDQQQALDEYFSDKEIPEAQSTPERLYITADGTTVCEADGWHEAKVGCIYWADKSLKRCARHVSSFENSERFGWDLWLEACRCGLRQAEELVYLGDGAGWIRTEHRRHFGRATFIIDWYHACEHIWDCAKALLGEGTAAAKQWAQGYLDLLWQGCTKQLLDGLRLECKAHRGRKRSALEEVISYVSTNEEQMRYDVFRAAGYDIGSGAVEADCKNVVGKRLKQSGMRWSRAGSSSTLALRTTWLNRCWKQLWSQKPLAA
jgi:hypothetical protein